MKKNLYYRFVFRRRNVPKEILLNLFLSLASWPRMLLEVFIRKDFGERYFSPFTAGVILVVFSLVPFAMNGMFSRYGVESFVEVATENVTWYLYLAAFLYACILRWREVRRLPSVFDFARFSLSAGQIHPLFYALRVGKKSFDQRTIETLLEPGLFFVIGLLLWWMDQTVGPLLVVSSILYSLSYVAAYHKGDEFIMNTIDEDICNKGIANVFGDDCDPSGSHGVSFYCRKPADPKMRRELADMLIDEDDVVEVR